MQADAFWKNYVLAEEWQKRHSITWWRARCMALDHENKLLRDKVRLLAQHRDCRENCYRVEDNGDTRDKNHDTDNENLEFNVTEDVLNFFETSERHKREMQRKRGSNRDEEENSEEKPFISAAERAYVRQEETDLLYGDANSKILVMENVLQSTVEQYKAVENPQYWPNVSLKP